MGFAAFRGEAVQLRAMLPPALRVTKRHS